jgi:ABC-type oligopeptide transport system substrate-binding subunit
MTRTRILIALFALVFAAPASAATLRANMSGRIETLDPALAYVTNAWQVEYATCLKLVNYQSGSSIPQLEAATNYSVSRDGLTYTFVVPLAKYFFADGEPVGVSSFVRALTRSLDPSLNGPARFFMHDVLGADAYESGAASSISGIATQGSLLKITLTRPAPDLLARLAMPFFCAVPDWAPSRPDDSLPSAGPYYASSIDLNGLTTLSPNPYYTGKRPQNWDEIDLRAFQNAFATEAQLASGDTDWAFDGLPVGDYASFAAAHPGQLFVNRALGLQYFVLRSSRPLMSDPNMRRAFNLALDRCALAQSAGAFGLDPTDQIIPEGAPGFQDVSLVAYGGDLLAAQFLAAPHAGESAVVLYPPTPAGINRATIATSTLQSLGLTVTAWQAPSRADEIAIEANPASPFDVSVEGWVMDYSDPFDVINVLTHTGSPNNYGAFSDPAFDAREDAASALFGPDRYAAYAQLDEDLMRQDVPLAPYGNINDRNAFSARIGCQSYSPPFGMDMVALCLK